MGRRPAQQGPAAAAPPHRVRARRHSRTPRTSRLKTSRRCSTSTASCRSQDLTTDKAVELLTVLGVEPALAQRFPPVFGGNPLVLKLIHRFVTTNDSDEVEQLLADGEKARRDAPSGEVGLRFVYERILNRIKKPRVKALAYPGVVLRRVTPELILEVLAPTCPVPLDVTTPADARASVQRARRARLARDPHRARHGRASRGRAPAAGAGARAQHRRRHQGDPSSRPRAYYAARPASVPADVAGSRRSTTGGSSTTCPQNMPESQAEEVVRQLGGDIEFWPVRSRATVKSLAGRHDPAHRGRGGHRSQRPASHDPGLRLEKRLESSTSARRRTRRLSSACSEEDAGTTAAIPDSRWRLLFDRGDFEFMTEVVARAHRVRPLLHCRPLAESRRAARRTNTRGSSRSRSCWSSAASDPRSRRRHWQRSIPAGTRRDATAPPSQRSPEMREPTPGSWNGGVCSPRDSI